MTQSLDHLTILPSCPDDIEILLLEPDFIVLNKPAGLLSVPGRHPANRDCAITRLQQSFAEASVVHRLDFDTSGIMVFARNRAAHAAIARQFQERETFKIYTALVAGVLSPAEGRVDLPIAPDPEARPKCKVCLQTGKPSLTHYRALAYDAAGNATRVWLKPETGRSHQLRLHMSALGHPILGCDFYGSDSSRQAADRLLLHATTLGFTRPDNGLWLQMDSPCPF